VHVNKSRQNPIQTTSCHDQKKNPVEQDGVNVCILASGSRGNAIYVSRGETSILIDAGLSGIQIQRRMASRGIKPENLDAILVTHEHSDHILGAGVLSRRYHLPVYISRDTKKAAGTALGKINKVNHFSPGESFNINGMCIHPFSISHDAVDPSGFTITSGNKKIGIATDLGIATSMVKEHLKQCALLIIESNHDPEMLDKGPYPWPLKQRIKSRTGHLSNPDAAKLITEVQSSTLSHIILGHLSHENNTPEIAENTVKPVVKGTSIRVHVALQDVCGQLIRL